MMRMMMMMMMMNELTLTWRIVPGLQGHVTVKDETCSCKSEQKARSSVYCAKLTMMAMTELTPVDCSREMRQLPGRHGRTKLLQTRVSWYISSVSEQ